MSSTHHALHYHFVFGTKHQKPFILPLWRERLHAYLGGIIRNLDFCPEKIGGVADHVHLLVSLHPTCVLSDFMRDVKRQISAWIHQETNSKEFQWQDGYGVFTVSVSQMETVRKYIANQEEHHRSQDFMSEYIAFLERHNIPYKEAYLW